MNFASRGLLEFYGILLIVGGLTLLRNVLSKSGRERLAENADHELMDLLTSVPGRIFLGFAALVLTGLGIFFMIIARDKS